YAMISLSQEILEAMDDRHLDLFFRLIPIKQSGEQMDVRQRLPRYYESKQVTMLGTPLEIETNYRDFHTTLFIPFAKSNIDVKKVNLNMLRVYIEHSDGEKVMREGTLVRDEQGNAIGLSIDISKFSTFTIVELKQPTVISDTDDVIEAPIEELEEEIHSHTAYIKGYTDG